MTLGLTIQRKVSRVQVVLIALFTLANIILFLASTDARPYPGGPLLNATYHAAADGQRYWNVAINLAEKQTFTVAPLWDSRPELPLIRSGPLPALVFAVPIKLVGFENAPIFIVSFQCFLLYMISFFSRGLTSPFAVNKTFLQCLVLFNPNLIGLAHVAQSDMIFSFLFVGAFAFIHSTIEKPHFSGFKSWIIIGLLCGLMTLTRSIGLIISVGLPIILLIILLFYENNWIVLVKKIFPKLLVATIVFILVVFPWSLRNYTLFGTFSPVLGTTAQLQYIYSTILHSKELGNTSDRNLANSETIASHLRSTEFTNCDSSSISNPICDKTVREAYLKSIFSESPIVLGKAFFLAASRTLISGGSKRIADYLGIVNKKALESLWEGFEGISTLDNLFRLIFRQSEYLWIFLVSIGFVLVTRIVGVVGLYVSLSKSRLRPYGVLYLLTTSLFLSIYFVVSTSRFRAPLEPILMLYTVLGVSRVASFILPKGTKISDS